MTVPVYESKATDKPINATKCLKLFLNFFNLFRVNMVLVSGRSIKPIAYPLIQQNNKLRLRPAVCQKRKSI